MCIDRHGRESLAVYVGNPSAHSLSSMIFSRVLMTGLGTRHRFSASTVDQMPRHVASGYVFGSPVAVPVPDLDRTDYLLMLGANPYASNGSMCTAPDFPGRLEAIRARGGKVVVVDPRRSKTAEEADEWVSIRPGFRRAAARGDRQRDGRRGSRRSRVRTSASTSPASTSSPRRSRRSPPERVAGATGVDAATIRRLARRDRRGTDGGGVRPDRHDDHRVRLDRVVADRRREHPQRQSRSTRWVDVLDAGGRRSADPRQAGLGPWLHGRPRARRGCRGHPEVMGEYPVARARRGDHRPRGEGQVRALVTLAGNPVLSTPNSEQLAGRSTNSSSWSASTCT